MLTDTSHCDFLWINANLATLAPGQSIPYGALRNHAIGVQGRNIALIAPTHQLDLRTFRGELRDARGGWITPGLIDSHTHLVFGGQRATEFELRQQGASYEDIARGGGGILATVRATRKLDEGVLLEQALPRLQALVSEGVTTVEIKSGYGLSTHDELKMLRVARALEKQLPVRIRTTLLAAHALPPEYADAPDRYIDLVCQELIPAAAEAGLADAVDVFCERIAFNLEQAERVFAAAQAAGLGIKAHVEQLSHLGGAELAARYGAWSVDHLEYLDPAGVAALAHAGTVATLLPGAFYFLRETRQPPVSALLAAGVPVALATDLNPGSSPLASLRLMMNMGCTLFGLTPEQALAGVTGHAAQALGLQAQLGTLEVGKQADLLLWEIDEPAQLAYEFGVPRLVQRMVAGYPDPIRHREPVERGVSHHV